MAPVIRGNSLYTMVDGPSWEEAYGNAKRIGGSLVAISSKEEENVVIDLAISSDPTKNWWWMGMVYNTYSQKMEWTNGEAGTYANWYKDSLRVYPNIALAEGFHKYSEFTNDPGRNWEGSNPSMGLWAIALPTSERSGVAEIPFIQRGDSAYVIVQGPTWEEAEANAQALGGHLVTINDAAENDWILENLDSAEQAWIGLDFDNSTNQWSWVSGDNSEFRNWNEGEPSANNSEWEEFYGVIRKEWGGRWNDAGDHHAEEVIYGIAEIKLSDLGVPSSGGGGSTGGGDVTLPTLQSTTATNNKLILTFSEDIQIAGGGDLNPAYMTVTVDGQNRKITSSQITTPDQPSIHTASQLALTLSGRSLDRASSINVSYNQPTNGSNQGFITDLAGNKLAVIKSQSVDTYSTSDNISKRGIASAYKNIILTGNASISGYGNTQHNTITGNDANNILDGLAGSDTILGGLGDDTYFVDSFGDVVTEVADEGADTVTISIYYDPTTQAPPTFMVAANVEHATLIGSSAINITGNASDNTLTGNIAANVLNGNDGIDTLVGGNGNDTYIVNSASDIIIEAGNLSNTDLVESSISWFLGFNLENLTLTGTSPINGTGNERNNTIVGNDAANVIDGGNSGRDSLTGFLGADTFRFSTRPSSFRNTTADQITDFSSAQGDKIQIAKSAFGITTSTATLSVVSNAAALNTALSSASIFVYNTANGELHWNQNGITRGAGSGGVLAILDNKVTLSSGDLMLV